MVRPRASDRNLSIAVAFGSMVVMKTGDNVGSVEGYPSVAFNGRNSIFAVFSTCLPDLARDSRDKHPKNRHGVTEIELNKALHSVGLKSVRKRERHSETGATRWLPKVWDNCRWVDPADPNDLKLIADRLCDIRRMCPETHACSLHVLQETLARVRCAVLSDDSEQEGNSAGEDSGEQPTRNPSKRPNLGTQFTASGILPPLRMLPNMSVPSEMMFQCFPHQNVMPLVDPSLSSSLRPVLRCGANPHASDSISNRQPPTMPGGNVFANLLVPDQGQLESAARLPAAPTQHAPGMVPSLLAAAAAAHCATGMDSRPQCGQLELLMALAAGQLERSQVAPHFMTLAAECEALREQREALLSEVLRLRGHPSA